MRGRYIALSAPRRLVGDLMWFSTGLPRVTVQRSMNLAPLRAARVASAERPSWTALFTKGYALLARETPELRRAYFKLPWPYLYEYHESVASVAFERDFDGEAIVLLGRIQAPENRSLAELEAAIGESRVNPLREVPEFRRALLLARAPRLLRRLLMGIALNVPGLRATHFGTFMFSVYSGLGAESFNPLTPLTTLLNYGRIAEDGTVNVRILYDHRVMDGATVARALERFEGILNGALVAELTGDGEPERPAA